MSDCSYCHKSLDAGENNNTVHYTCIDEWNKRKTDNTCIRCGQDSVHYCYSCKSCSDTNVGYQNYLGP